MDQQLYEAPPRVDEDIYTLFMSKLPLGFPDRMNIALVAGYMASVGPQVHLIASAIRRSEPWVRQRIRAVELLMADPKPDAS